MTAPGYCKNCNHPIDNKFCPFCGQNTSTSKFSFHQLGHHFLHGFFHLEHGILYTMKELCINPGRMIKDYLYGKRIKYFNPFTFILLLGSLSVIVLSRVHYQSFTVDLGIVDASNIDAESWAYSIKHYSYRILLGIPLYALLSKIFYFKKDYNYPEHLIANTYLRGMADILVILSGVIVNFIEPGTATVIIKVTGLVIGVLYYAWAYAVLFDNRISFGTMTKGSICVFIAVIAEVVIINLIVFK